MDERKNESNPIHFLSTRAHHGVGFDFSLVDDFFGLFQLRLVLDHLPGLVDGFKGLLRPLCVVGVLIRMDENGETTIGGLHRRKGKIRINLKHPAKGREREREYASQSGQKGRGRENRGKGGVVREKGESERQGVSK